MSAPHRHDMDKSSCINGEVERLNRLLKKRMKIHDHVRIIDVNLDRSHFTQHGLHLNYKGKDAAASAISTTIEKLHSRNKHVITLEWAQKKEDEGGMNEPSRGPSTRSSTRHMKTPGHLQDFLCLNAQQKR